MPNKENVSIVLGETADEIEKFAAAELQKYLRILFGLDADITTGKSRIPGSSSDVIFLAGTRENHSAMIETRCGTLPSLTDQGFLLRKIRPHGQNGMVLLGGSPRAVLWAVYDLVERWGVRYLLHEDAIPEGPGHFHLPDIDSVQEPGLTIRQWRVINDFACGPESWGMEHYRPVIDQLAKLKFNRILLAVWPWQPFVHYEYGGIKRRSAWLWFDYHYPITEDMVGRELYGDEDEFWNPDFPRQASYEELTAAGQAHAHNLMEYAHERGMECVLTTTLTEFTPEFAPLLTGSQKVHQLGGLTIVPGADTDVDDPTISGLATSILQATINTYPEADFIAFGMPEFRQWSGHYERAWEALDAKYGIEKIRSLEDTLRASGHRTGNTDGEERSLQEVKGDIVGVYFYDRLLKDLQVTRDTCRPEMRFIYNSVAEELFPVMPSVLMPGWEFMNVVDYTAQRILKRREVLGEFPGRRIPATLIFTLHDDNVGVLPQLSTGSLHELIQALRQYDWAGFSTRYWLIADHDPCMAYLAKAAWDETATPQLVYQDQIKMVYGEDCVKEMLDVFRELEEVTIMLEWHGMGLTFPVPGMIMKHWTPDPMTQELAEARQGYRRALSAARAALPKAKAPGRDEVKYWIGRLDFGIGFLDTIEAVRNGAIAESEGNQEEAMKHAESALILMRDALAAYASVARDQSDRGAIAEMNEYVCRPLKAKVEELK